MLVEVFRGVRIPIRTLRRDLWLRRCLTRRTKLKNFVCVSWDLGLNCETKFYEKTTKNQ
jgi:hypothetical protein